MPVTGNIDDVVGGDAGEQELLRHLSSMTKLKPDRYGGTGMAHKSFTIWRWCYRYWCSTRRGVRRSYAVVARVGRRWV